MAWRETRATWGRMSLFALCVACGVGALVATESATAHLTRRIKQESRSLMAGDCSLTSRRPFDPDLRARVAALVAEGVVMAETLETLSMVASPDSTATRLVELKAVSPDYPLYGRLVTEPADAVERFGRGGGVLVSPSLVAQTGLTVGSRLTVGELTVPIVGVLTSEPDRLGDSFRMGPRVLLRRTEMDRTRLTGWGSRVSYRLLFKLPARLDVQSVRRRLVPDASDRRLEFRSADGGQPQIEGFLNRTNAFLNLAGLAVMLLAGVGIAVAIHTFVRQRLETMAILKCLGATAPALIGVYLTQAVILGTAGCIMGAFLGVAMLKAVPGLLAGVLPFAVEMPPIPLVIARDVGTGLLLTVAFSLLPLLRVRRVSPRAIFNRAVEDGTGGAARDPAAWATLAGLAALCTLLTVSRAGTMKLAMQFLGSFALTVVALLLAARLLLWVVRVVPAPGAFTLRHALVNLRRPGNQTSSVLVATGLSVFLLQSVYLVDTMLADEFLLALPDRAPNLYIVDVQDDQKGGVADALASHGIQALETVPLVRGRIVEIGPKPISELHPDPAKAPWWVNREYVLTCRNHVGAGESVVAGRLWSADGPRRAEISVETVTASRFGLGLGDRVTLDVQGRRLQVEVTSLRSVRWGTLRPNFFLVLPPYLLEGLARTHFTVAHVGTEAERAALQRALVRRFPNLMVIDISAGVAVVRAFVDRLSWVIGLAALLCLVGGLLVLIASIVMTRRHRTYECALLKVHGATRPMLVRLLALEYLLLGLIGGTVGALSAWLAAHWIATHTFEMTLSGRLPSVALGGLLAGALTALAGALASSGILSQPPLAILRDE
ncbi:MAG: FtsX-like permease family protein [Candidatus Riflebacteria bacterium]|nr:FtsX-like permease family protein [Candidatus Riflebacteria bacterium]